MTGLSPVALLNLASVYVFWGSTYLAIRFVVAVWPPFLSGATRFAAAGGALLLLARLLGQSLKLNRHSLVTSLVSGLILFPLGNGAVVWAERTTSSGLAATVIATSPVWMTLFGWGLGTHARPTLRVFLSLALGLSGVALLVGSGGVISPASTLILLAGSVAWSFASVWVASRKAQGPILVRSAYQMLAGAVGFTLLAVLAGDPSRITPAMFRPGPLLALAYLVVFGSGLGYLSFAWLVSNVPPHIAGTYAFVNPVFAVLLGTLFGERLTAQTVLAIVLVIGGVVLAAAIPETRARLQQEPVAE
jgi:drug/metabolite transporter (DMT)-like permease